MCLYNKVKQEKHLSPRFIREEEEVKDKVVIEIDPEITVDKDKILVKIGMVMIIEGMGTHKISVEILAGTAEILTETTVVTGVDSRERRLSPRRYNNNNRQNANSRFRSRSRSRSNSR